MNYRIRKATIPEIPQIWDILHQAILRRKKDGSNQWQDGYPNREVVQQDIAKGTGFVLTEGEIIIGYCAILINDEPEYVKIKGKWMTDGDFVVMHRLAISEQYLGKGLAQKFFGFVEEFARSNKIHSIKADTNFDNIPMLKIFEKLGYTFCGEVYFRGTPRKAYEKRLDKN